MSKMFSSRGARARRSLADLAVDTGGNVILIVAASIFPLMALVGSGIDMGRGYLAQTRLQQACDAGTLAARKRLGTQPAVTGVIPTSVADTGQRFFNLNYRSGSYASNDRQFVMTLQPDFTITGQASADVETTIMGVFGYREIPVSVTCSAQISMANTDIMMVLDTTGSMLNTNPGDTMSRMEALRSTVRSFHTQMEANKSAGTRIRYGFLPYSTNVNVGGLLRPEWLVNEWQYHFREALPARRIVTQPKWETAYVFHGGSYVNITSYYAPTCPGSTTTWNLTNRTTDAAGWTHDRYRVNGTSFWCAGVDANTTQVSGATYTDYDYTYSYRENGTESVEVGVWRYGRFKVDLAFLATSTSKDFPMGGNPLNPSPVTATYRGCIEERDTYEINDYSNVNLSRALDLDLDLVPTAGDEKTQWRPMLNELGYIREMWSTGSGRFTPAAVNSEGDFVNAYWWGLSACPSPAQKLKEMTAGEVGTYVDNLVAQGATYHDIGMIWGGRLLSPTGLFASENADVNGVATMRHMIYLTDGETAPLDVSYGSYGIEPLDRRRWDPSSALSLTQTVENRFAFACNEVKRRNIQVWVISFGTAPNPVMQNCAGPGHYFVAADAAALETSFSEIARRMSGLRLTR